MRFRCSCSIRKNWYAQVNMLLCTCVRQSVSVLHTTNNFDFQTISFSLSKNLRNISACVCVCNATWLDDGRQKSITAMEACERAHAHVYIVHKCAHSMYIVIIPFTDFKVFDFNYKLRKTAKLHRYLFDVEQPKFVICVRDANAQKMNFE